MARRYLVDPLPEPGDRTLPADVAHHLGTVLRARPGTVWILHDGRGREAEAEILSHDDRGAGARRLLRARVGPARPTTAPEPRLALTAAFAPPRSNRAEWIFEHGTEVGIVRFVPLLTERVRPEARAAKKLERWRRLAEAAAGQCDRGLVPQVAEPIPLAAFLDELRPSEQPAFVAAPGAPVPFAPLARDVVAATLVVGPEGGFAPGEAAALDSAGVLPRGLGPLILRAETAVLAAAAVLLQPVDQRSAVRGAGGS